jgi:hypothetical protein
MKNPGSFHSYVNVFQRVFFILDQIFESALRHPCLPHDLPRKISGKFLGQNIAAASQLLHLVTDGIRPL